MNLHELLLDALKGINFSSYEFAVEMHAQGLAEYDGNQHNESWCWRQDRLKTKTEAQLLDLYAQARKAKGL